MCATLVTCNIKSNIYVWPPHAASLALNPQGQQIQFLLFSRATDLQWGPLPMEPFLGKGALFASVFRWLLTATYIPEPKVANGILL